jgi:hypothetical protein
MLVPISQGEEPAMTSVSVDQDCPRTSSPLGGSLAYLLMNLPLGIAGFVTLFTLLATGISTAVVWVGLPLLAFAVLLARGAARAERARVYALLDVFVPLPYLPLPAATQRLRWKARLRDVSTWRDLAYFFVLFPVGIIEFTLMVTFWSSSLALAGLPIYFRFLPEGAYYFPAFDVRWITVDSTVGALPWAALGVLFIAVSVALTRSMAGIHGRLAWAMLGPTAAQRRRLEASSVDAEAISTVTR